MNQQSVIEILNSLRDPVIKHHEGGRKTQWLPLRNSNGFYIWAADSEVDGHQLDGLVKHIRGVGDTPITIISGGHGTTSGQNWVLENNSIKFQHWAFNSSSEREFQIDKEIYADQQDVSVVHIDELGFNGMQALLTNHSHVILAYCYSRMDSVLRYTLDPNTAVTCHVNQSETEDMSWASMSSPSL